MKTNHEHIPWGLWAVLLLEYLFIFFFLLNYYFAFMQRETIPIHSWILSNGKAWHWADFSRSLNIDILEENGSRLSRPISNFFDIIDTKFRAYCWNFIPPHPSLSCLWPLLFIGIPVFLFKFFKNMGCYASVAFGGTCLYLSSIGFLGPVVMMFRSSKNLVNFFAVLSLFLGSRIYKKIINQNRGCSVKDMPHFGRDFALFLCSIFLGFFCDETGLFVYIMAAIIVYPVFFICKERWAVLSAFLLLPIAYIGFIDGLLPYIHLYVRGHMVSLGNYGNLSSLASISVQGVMTNLVWLFSDHPHMQLNIANLWPYNPLLFLLQLMYSLSMCWILFLFLTAACRDHLKMRMMQIKTCGALLLIFVLFQSLLLSRFWYTSWGVWWYGSLFSLLYFLFFTFVLQLIAEGKAGEFFRRFFIFIIFLGVSQGLAFCVYRVDIIEGDRQGYNPLKGKDGGYTIEEIFDGRIGPYYKSLNWFDIVEKSQCRRIFTVLTWDKAKQKNIAPFHHATAD